MKIPINFISAATLLFAGSLSAQQASLEAPAMGIVDETVPVKYSGPGDAGDEMTIGDARGIELRGTNPADLSGDGEGLVNLLMPTLPGLYTIIYRGNEGLLATRKIQVTNPQFGISVAESAVTSQRLSVYWTGMNQGKAVIALRSADGSVLDTAALPVNQRSGSVQLTTPSEAGVYEVSYVIGDDIKASRNLRVTPIAESTLSAPNQVYTGSSFKVSFTGSFNIRDHIVIVESPATATSQVVAYSYLDSNKGTAVLQAPMTAGLYEVQYRNRAADVLATAGVEVLVSPDQTGSLTVNAREKYQLENDTSLLVILDASGSMLKEQKGEDRIDIAKDTLLGFMEKRIPTGVSFAFRAFGHIEEGSCEGELLIPASPFDYEGMAPIVREVEAINLAKTPIAASLLEIPSDLQNTSGDRVVVLLTDGKETCDGDPAAAVQKVRADYPDTRINIVGYNITNDEIQRDFESWAALGGGQYFSASEAESLDLALNRSVALPFDVYQGTRLVASGRTGDAPFVLPNGSYEIAYFNRGKEIWKSIEIEQGETVTVSIP